MGKEPQASRESKKFLSAYPQEAKRIEGALPGCDCKSVQSLVADLRASMTEEEQAIGAYEFRGRQAKNDPLVAGVYHHIAPEERQHLAELKNQEMRLMDKVRACNCPLPGKGRTAFSGGKGGVSWGH